MRGDTMNEYTLKLSAKDIFEKEFEKSPKRFQTH